MTILFLSLPVLLILAAFGAELWILPHLRERIGSHRTSK
jgi:hypothetical protein